MTGTVADWLSEKPEIHLDLTYRDLAEVCTSRGGRKLLATLAAVRALDAEIEGTVGPAWLGRAIGVSTRTARRHMERLGALGLHEVKYPARRLRLREFRLHEWFRGRL